MELKEAGGAQKKIVLAPRASQFIIGNKGMTKERWELWEARECSNKSGSFCSKQKEVALK